MSWKSLGQCLEYAYGEIRYPASVPVVRGVICCQHCQYLSDRRLSTYQCKITGEWIITPADNIGANCPIKFQEVTK